MGMKLKQSLYAIVILALYALLVGCTLNISKKSSDFDETKDSAYYLSQVDSATGSAKTNWQLLAVRALVKENKISQAKSILSQLTDLNVAQQNEKLLLLGEIAVKTGKSFDLNQLNVKELNNRQLYRYYSIKLAFDAKSKNINQQAHDYIDLEIFATDQQRKQVIHNTFNFFKKLTQNQLSSISVYDNETTLQGWVDLAFVFLNNRPVPVKQDDENGQAIAANAQNQNAILIQAIKDWAMRYPDHPAKLLIPSLTGEESISVDNANAKKVALLLPLNGSSRIFGNTIRQGYVDAIKFYPQEPQQDMVILDTSSAPMESLIQQAQDQNVELIVGPLLKDDVTKIKQLSPSIPVLALNKVDNSVATTNKMCYFALSPEDEAIDAANHIYAQNKTRPLLLVPQTDLGRRVAQSFAKQWSQLSANSSQAYVQYFANASSLRANMNRNVGIRLTGSPVFADDASYAGSASGFDAVYVYASYDEMTLIKPMLDMGAGKTVGNASSSVLLYSSSKSHTANRSNDFNYDMNQTEYADIPMIVNLSDSMTTMVPGNIQKDYSLLRLYAMGIDAWRLANRFNQLDSYQADFLNGMTGKLSTSNQCEVTRSLSWQQYAYVAASTNTTNEE